MSIRIAVDGYNLIGASSGMDRGSNIEGKREALIESLIEYKNIRSQQSNIHISVIFDGTKSGILHRNRELRDGIEVVFSRCGEKADDVLKEMAHAKREGLTIVTSDREVADYASHNGTIVISSEEFEMIIHAAISGEGRPENRWEEDRNRHAGYKPPEKKGPARKLSRKKRKKLQRIKKL